MNRLFLASALIVLGVIGCKKNPDPAARPADQQIAADTSRAAVATPPADTVHAATQPHDSAATAPATTAGATTDGDVTGAYFPIEKLPAEFSELDFLGLATIDENAKPAPLNGFLRPKKQSAKDYHLISPTISGDALSFTTETINGVSYSFSGTFTQHGNFPENPPPSDAPVLKGTLKKMKNGSMVAESAVNFAYSAGG